MSVATHAAFGAMGKMLARQFPVEVLREEVFRDEQRVHVEASAWHSVASFLKDDPSTKMDHFIDLTAVDYIEQAPEQPRFEVVLFVRSQVTGQRLTLMTRVQEDEKLESLADLWTGANWAEREVWDMFGIPFAGHPDLRRILLYEEFEGYPLRKDYPIDRTQPLVEYRDVEGTEKLAPFGVDEGEPWSRHDWGARVAGRNLQVSPAIATQQSQRSALSQSPGYTRGGADDAADRAPALELEAGSLGEVKASVRVPAEPAASPGGEEQKRP